MKTIYVKPVGRGNWRKIGIDVSAATDVRWAVGMLLSVGSRTYRVVEASQ